MKKFPYQKKLETLNITEEKYKEMQEYLQNSNIDLSHVLRKGFRLFKWNKGASYSVCWLSDINMKMLFDNPELFLESLA
jgi:hypothetical protein